MRSLASSTILFLHLNVLILGDDMSVVVPMSHGLKYPPFEIAENMGAGRLCLLVNFTIHPRFYVRKHIVPTL